jgi:hypothetical protein
MTYALAKTSAAACTTRRSRFDSYRKKQRGTCCLVGRGDAPVLGEGCEPLTSRQDARLRDRLPNCQQRSPYRASGLVLLVITGHARTPARLLRYGEIDLRRLAVSTRWCGPAHQASTCARCPAECGPGTFTLAVRERLIEAWLLRKLTEAIQWPSARSGSAPSSAQAMAAKLIIH